MDKDDERVCGGCRHWCRAGDYRWGGCDAPLPAYLMHADLPRTGSIFPDDKQAQECEVFEVNGSQQIASGSSHTS